MGRSARTSGWEKSIAEQRAQRESGSWLDTYASRDGRRLGAHSSTLAIQRGEAGMWFARTFLFISKASVASN